MTDLEQIKKIYRIISWASLVGLVIIVILIFKKAPPPNVPYDSKASARAEQKFEAAGQAAASGQPAQVQVDPTELNSYLKDNLQLAGSEALSQAVAAAGSNPGVTPNLSAAGLTSNLGVPKSSIPSASDIANGASTGDDESIDQVQSQVKDVKVNMEGDLVKAYVIFDYHGQDLSLELDGHLGSQNGYVKFDPVAGKLGSLPLPMSTLTAAVEKMMSSPENREKMKLPSDINDIAIQNGQAVVNYK